MRRYLMYAGIRVSRLMNIAPGLATLENVTAYDIAGLALLLSVVIDATMVFAVESVF